MNQSSNSYGWTLAAIAVLWGLAGALDQPLDESQQADQHEPARLADEPAALTPTVLLRCAREHDSSMTHAPRGSDAFPEGRIRVVGSIGGASSAVVAFPVLRCQVLN